MLNKLIKNIFPIIIGMMIVIPGNGCGIFAKSDKEWKPVSHKKKSFVHTVQWRGETLKIIAKWYTGDSRNWKILADANPVINAVHLAAGNKIFIPRNLLKRKTPLTKKYIKNYYNKGRKTSPKKKDELELFGPK